LGATSVPSERDFLSELDVLERNAAAMYLAIFSESFSFRSKRAIDQADLVVK
jgi:hypothetical protein